MIVFCHNELNECMRTIFTILIIIAGLYLLYAMLVYLFQKQLIFHPVSLPKNHIFTFHKIDTRCREINIKTEDGVALNALFFKADDPKGVIVYYHGNAGNLDNWGLLADEYIERQYHFLVWDYREYGKTGGDLTYENLIEDSETVFDYARENYPDLEQIPYGASLGTALAAHVANRYQTTKLILETPYYSMKRISKEYFPGLPYDWLLKYPLNTYKQLKGFQGDVYIVHGTADEVIPYKHSTMLKDAFPKQVSLTTVHNSGHNDLPFHDPYRKWLDEVLGDKVGGRHQ